MNHYRHVGTPRAGDSPVGSDLYVSGHLLTEEILVLLTLLLHLDVKVLLLVPLLLNTALG